MTRTTELREMHDEELSTKLTEARQELFNLRFQHVTGQLDNSARLGQVRKDIARMNTILREREIAMAEAAEQRAPEPGPVQDDAAVTRRARVLGSRRAAARTRRGQEQEDQ